MTEPTKEITITIPASEAAQQHIEGLQATLTKRNQQIERLHNQLMEAQASEPTQAALAISYRNGWRDAASHLMESSRIAAHALGKVNKNAFEIYLQKDAG
jgi:hypothetical protein